MIAVSAPPCAATASVRHDGQFLMAQGFGSISSPGNPALPFKEVRVLLPPDVIPESVSVTLAGAKKTAKRLDRPIAPAPPFATSQGGRQAREWGRGKVIQGNRNMLVYQRDAFYPGSHVELISTGCARTSQVATVRYYPYRYNPVSGLLQEVSKGRIVVSYQRKRVHESATRGPARGDAPFARHITAATVNSVEAEQYHPHLGPTPIPANDDPPVSSYVIITTASIANGSAKLQDFVAHKTTRGFSVAVRTESDWGGGIGDVAAENIRSYLQARYIADGIQYVLLIGNPDPVDGDVPMKMLWPRYASGTYREAPSDYYYADLTGNWDLNGDGYYGDEEADFGPGGIDRLADVIVGRIPFSGDFTALDSILQKTMSYENAQPAAWMRNVLLSMKPSDSSTPGYQLGEAIKNDVLTPASMNAVRVYDSNYGLSPAPEYVPCSYGNVISAWQQHAGFHFWWTHGNENTAIEVLNGPNVQNLDDTYPAFTFQCSCLNGYPERTDALRTGSGDSGILWTPKRSGVLGPVSLTLVDPGTSHSLTSTLEGGSNVRVTLAHSGSAVTSTANEVVACINSTPGVRDVVAAAVTGTGTGVVGGLPTTSLTNLALSLLKRGAIATNAATRVSWYYVGETSFNVSDSNAAMALDYSKKLIRDHLPCGDAHYAMLADVPNEIWMNHCVFNVYGDPSIRYPIAPIISHTPLANTDITTQPYPVVADVTSNAPLGAGQPVLMWNTDGGQIFSSMPMGHVSGTTYSAAIPAQPYGTTVYYYIQASDVAGVTSYYPSNAPQSLLSFSVAEDTSPPAIAHTPLADTADKFGPYLVDAAVTDDLGVAAVRLHYCVNGGAYSEVPMSRQAGDVYQGSIPGPTHSGDTISYYITAVDSSVNANECRSPAGSDSYSFAIGSRIYVAVHNYSSNSPPYYVGGNSNAWADLAQIMEDDPAGRFQVNVVTNLVPSPGAVSIEGQDVLILPDNPVPTSSLQAVSDWFQPGKVIVTMDSSICYASYTGWMWAASAGKSGYGTYWDYLSEENNQEIWAGDPITSGYTVGQIIGSVYGDAQLLVNKLPADAHILTMRSTDHTRAYAVYRDVPGRGRLVVLGPFVRPTEDQYALIREAAVGPAQARQIRVVSPNGGESYRAGDTIMVSFTCSGAWQESDKIQLEYRSGPEAGWLPVPGAQAVNYDAGSFDWDSAGLGGSHDYEIRATWSSGALTDESDAPFTILPTVDIPASKSVSDGELIRLEGKVVTCGASGMTYVQEPNRLGGLRVQYPSNVAPSALVDIVGAMATVSGERVICAESVEVKGVGVQLEPLAMRVDALAGGGFGLQGALAQYRGQQMIPTAGLNNIGLLVRVAGKVAAVGQDFFYLDDGTGCSDGTLQPGVRVTCPETFSVSTNQYVVVTAVSSVYSDGLTTWRGLLMPDRQSVKVLQ